jgi:hypothetical protein
MYPRYAYPARVVLGLVRDGLLGRRRTFQTDARRCIAGLNPPLRVLGLECVPHEGCYVITLNHYYRPGFGAQWTALAISASLTPPVRWIMTHELTFPGHWIAPLGMPVSRFLLGRAARTYDFIPMPPMPPRRRDVEARAAAVREAVRFVRQTPHAILALAPEGGDQPAGCLSMPPSGTGRFCLLLAAAGMAFQPVGVYESEGALTLNFGPPYELELVLPKSADDKDRLAARAVMSHIGPLLPIELRGEFSAEAST